MKSPVLFLICLLVSQSIQAGERLPVSNPMTPTPESNLQGIFGQIQTVLKQNPGSGERSVTLRWKEETSSGLHHPWTWEPGMQIYKPDLLQIEETVTVIWKRKDSPGQYDIWVYGSDRNGNTFADDLYAKTEHERLVIRYDAGKPSWELTRPTVFEGPIISRYRQVRPSDSAANVKAALIKQDGHLILTLSRAAETNQADDLPLTPGDLSFYVTHTAPEFLDFQKLSFQPAVFLEEP